MGNPQWKGFPQICRHSRISQSFLKYKRQITADLVFFERFRWLSLMAVDVYALQ